MGPGSRGACHRAALCADPLAWPGRRRVRFNFQTANSDTVIASQRVGAKRRPMTGSAKQSTAIATVRMDCFVAALLAMTSLQFQMRLRNLAARCARVVHEAS